MHCTITTPEALVFDGATDSVVVPAVDGELGFLKRHAPLVGTLGFGELRLRGGGETRRFFIDGGFVQVLDDQVTVLAVEAVDVATLSSADEKAALDSVVAAAPASTSSFEERDAHARRVAVARKRLKLASAVR